MSSSFSEVVFTARLAFSKRSWPFVAATAVPWLLCASQRCVSRLAAVASYARSLSSYYRFLSDGKWRLGVLFHSLFDLIVRTFHLTELTLVLDDTLSPKWGHRIYGTGSFFDHTRRPRPGYIWGHNWVVLAVVVPLGRTGWVALPFWIELYRSEKLCSPAEFRTRLQIAAGVLAQVRAWFPGPIELLADGAYANDSLVSPAAALNITVISRLRSNARLRDPVPPPQPKGKRGRKPERGAWLPKLFRLARAGRAFRTETVHIYGKTVEMRVREITAYWPPLGRVVKVVITRDPKNPRRRAYLMTTDLSMSALQVIERFARRWTIEQLFSIAKNQMGLDSAEVRKECSVIRHAALCIALITWAEVWAHRRNPSLWERSFAKKLAALRTETLTETIFASGPRSEAARRITETIVPLYAVATAVS